MNTHAVTNQPPPLAGYDPWSSDALLRATVVREGGGWIDPRAQALAALVGSERLQTLAMQANRLVPELRTHDRFGRRIDAVDYHPAYHELMATAFGAGLHSLAWTANRDGAFVARAALNYLWNQLEHGVSCPVTMSFAAAHMLRGSPHLAAHWEAKLLTEDYDPRPLPIAAKRAVTIGMAMTEKQGGSDLRANTTCAVRDATGAYRLTGHKWFCSAPMSDAFFSLARTDAGLTCFFVPRSLEDESRNTFLIQRLKDKCGNRSNASSEIEYDHTWAQMVGDEGRGIATIIEMAHLTRFDIVVANAGFMRAMLNEAMHHAYHRDAFGRRLAHHPLMQNVLADLAIETEAAMLVAFRLARAFDRRAADVMEAGIARLLTPIAKYWSCKRVPAVAVEAMECLGGAGYVEESPMARFYREAPLNSIWEGSGNVICLDVLRTMQREPEALAALMTMLDAAASGDSRLGSHLQVTRNMLADQSTLETRARVVVERLACAVQYALLNEHATAPVATAFAETRLGTQGGYAFGTLPAVTPCEAILERARLQGSP
jgi:putative acyl-CoA dehydrogenase